MRAPSTLPDRLRPGWLLTAVLVLAAGAAGTGWLAARQDGAPAGPAWQVPAVLVLLAVASSFGVEFRRRGQGDRLDLFEVALAVALVALPGTTVVGLVVVAKAAVLLVRRVPVEKTCFNVAQRALAAGLGALLLAVLRGPGPPRTTDLLLLAPALGLAMAVNAGAVLLVLRLVQGPRARRLRGGALVNGAVNLTAGLLAAWLWVLDPLAWPVLPVALLAMNAVTRRWAEREAASARLLGLQRASAVLAGPEPLAGSVDRFLAEVRRSFDCRGAELHLLDGPGPGGPGPLVVALLAERAPLRLPDPARPALDWLLTEAGWGDALVAPVVSGDAFVGVLVTHDRGGWEGFETRELGVLESVAAVLGEALLRERLAAALEVARSRWRAMVQHASDVVLVIDDEGRVTYANAAAGPAVGTLTRPLLVDLVEEGDRDAVQEALAAAWRGDDEVRRRVQFRSAYAQRWVEAVVTRLDGDLVLNGRDVTTRFRTEQRRADQARILELVARGAPLPETLADLVRVVEQQCPGSRAAVLVGTAPAPELLGHGELSRPAETALLDLGRGALLGLGRSLTTAAVPAADPGLEELGVSTLLVRPLRAAGTQVWGAFLLAHPDDDPVDAGVLLDGATRVAAIAVHHARVQGRLAHQAAHDPLTDLPNRVLFLDRLTRALRSSEREGRGVLVLFLDLDRFKVVNDSLGHRVGDVLLKAVADRLGQAVRPGDTVARFGGDEFTMLCESIVDEAHALQLVERVREALARPFAVGETEVYATASIGVALGSGTTRRPEVLVEDADAAMYRAKERGGNRFEVFDTELRDRALHRLDTQSALHRGLERDEFRVYYQPTVSLRSGALVGVEALVRWDRRGRGLVLPDAFIPQAEESGLIVPIGALVLDTAFDQAARWGDTAARLGAPAPSVSVNLSPRQLVDPGLCDLVRSALSRTGVDPSTITLEITETALIQDIASSGATLRELKGLGVQLFVDDFGTGYSSLTYLQRLPVDGVKVDRSFVAGLGRQSDAGAIVRAVVGLAHSLGLVAVAEGVETAEHARQLRALHCETAQGWYFGRPVPAEQIWLDAPSVTIP